MLVVIKAVAMHTPLQQDALSLLFPSPILRVNLCDAIRSGTLERLEAAVCTSWNDHLTEQQAMPDAGIGRATDSLEPIKARTGQEANEEFFYFQKRRYGVHSHSSSPAPEGWLATQAAQDLLGAVSAVAAGYLERVSHHAGYDIGRPWAEEDWEVDPDQFHVWASVHTQSSAHPRHVHMGAVLSAVFYVTAPPGAGQICFFDPRGDIPPFERQIRHSPRAGDLLVFPPWLSHAVASTASDAEGPRISISLNLVDTELESGRNAWGTATAALEVVTLEDGLGLEPLGEDGEDGADGEDGEGGERTSVAQARERPPPKRTARMGKVDEVDEALMRIRAALAAAGREGQDIAELRGVLGLVKEETEALLSQLDP